MDTKAVWMNGSDQLERIAAEIKTKAQACEHAVKIAINELTGMWAEIGELLAQARAHFASNEQFGKWVVLVELEEVGNRRNCAAIRVIAAHRAEIEQQARSLDSLPRTAEMFLQKLNRNRQLFGLPPLAPRSGEVVSGSAVSQRNESISIKSPENAKNRSILVDSGALPLIAGAASLPTHQVTATVSTESTTSAPSAVEAEETIGDTARRKGGPMLPQLPEALRPVLATYPPNVRVSLQRMYRHGGQKFIEWLAAKVKAGEISTDVPDQDSISARTFIRELHSSFDGRNWLISVRDRKDFDKTMSRRLMREYDALRVAAQAGTTFDQYDYKRREQAFTVRALKQPIGEDAPIRRYAASATPEPPLPTEARLADGSLLKPRPILVCGQVIWPRSGRDYADVYLVTHFIEQCLLHLYGENATADTIGRDIATMGTHYWGRHEGRWSKIAEIFSAVGIAIRVGNQKNPQPRHLWFMQMEPWHQKHAG
jgi:hypothetical protein